MTPEDYRALADEYREQGRDWELAYKLLEPFNRGHWILCQTQEEARFHLRNMRNNLPDHYVYVEILQDGEEIKHKGKGRDMYARVFGEQP